ncbi:MAG: Transcription antiterminator [uncultured Acidilobus sp. CIS]|nr:MAG: Transcription antiterminator [uncultured Acidilobus sp. CIS]
MSEQGQPQGQQPPKPSKFYALKVMGGYEEKVALILGERAKALNLDVRSIVFSKDYKNVVFVEVGDVTDLYYLIKGVRYIRGRRPIPVTVDDVIKLIKPAVTEVTVERGQLIQVIGGPFKGMKGRVLEVRKSDLDITLLEGDSKIVVTVPIDQVKPISESEAK